MANLEADVRRFFEEVWNVRRDQTIDEVLHPSLAGHMEGAEFTGTDAYKQALIKKDADALQTLEDAAAIKPAEARPLSLLGEIYFQSEKFQNAIVSDGKWHKRWRAYSLR